MAATSEPAPTIAALNAMDPAAFERVLGGIVEHSPWVARCAAAVRPFESIDMLHAALIGCIRAASQEAQIALFNIHPELAGREAVAGEMTAESTGEQGRLGLTHLNREEFAEIADLNRRYREKFGFPFIAALRLHETRDSVLASWRKRLDNDVATEMEAALVQIAEIVRGRLLQLVRAD